MGLFDAFFTKKDQPQNTVIDFNSLTSSLVTGNNYSLADSEDNTTEISTLDEDSAMKIGALYQGISIISETIASLPIYLYQNQDGFNQVFYDDYRSKVLSDSANETLSAFNLKKNLIKDLILYGNAYAKIIREGEKISLFYLPNDVVTAKKDSSGYYFEVQSYSTDINGENFESEIISYYDMLVLSKNNQYNSITGKGLLDYASDIFAMSNEETKYMYGLLANGLSAKAILSSPNAFKREIKTQLRKDLKNFYSGSNNAGRLMIMEGDVKVIPLSLTPTDLKLIENKNFTISEIARFLNIPKHMLSLDRQQGTYSNITQERLQLLTNTLMPYVTIIEQAMNQKLLEEDEIEKGYYFAFDTSELMKMTPEDQANYMLGLYKENIVTIEEVRATLGLGGDADTITQLKEIQAAKTQHAISSFTVQDMEKVKSSESEVDKSEEENKSESDIKNKKKNDASGGGVAEENGV